MTGNVCFVVVARDRAVTLYANGVARATPSKKSATPSLRLPPHHLAPYTGRSRVMKAPARTKERGHGQKVPEEVRTDINRSRQTGGLKRCCPYIAKKGAPRREGAPPAYKCAPRGVGAPLASNKFYLLLKLCPSPCGALHLLVNAPIKPVVAPLRPVNMLSLTFWAPLARQAPTVS